MGFKIGNGGEKMKDLGGESGNVGFLKKWKACFL
jgi:hypothetical protein